MSAGTPFRSAANFTNASAAPSANTRGASELRVLNRFCPASTWKSQTLPSPADFAIRVTSALYSAGSQERHQANIAYRFPETGHHDHGCAGVSLVIGPTA